jgi:hypothetical protein
MSFATVSPRAEEGRVLGGYRFIPTSGLVDPFITQHFRNAIGVSFASDVDVPLIIIEDTPPDTLLSLQGSLMFILVELEYQHVVHRRVALNVLMRGASRVGTSASSLIAQGISATLGWSVGTTVELWHNDSVLLSGIANLDVSRVLLIDLVQFAEDVVAGNTENASLLVTTTGGTFDVGLSAAWAVNPWSGVVGVARAGYADTDQVNTDLVWRLAGAYSMDFGQRGQAPIGLLAKVEADRLNQQVATNNATFSVGVGVFYTGREDINIGAELDWSQLPLINRDIVINPFSINFVLRYFF